MGIVGLGCVGVAYTAAFGVGSFLGLKTTKMHNMIPFLLLGVGIDNVFVITACLDQISVL